MNPATATSGNWLTQQMLVTFAILLSLPLWVGGVGLYQYLGVEIVIWMIFALGFNLLLGYTGLPSFGHGAYFGLGAYARISTGRRYTSSSLPARDRQATSFGWRRSSRA